MLYGLSTPVDALAPVALWRSVDDPVVGLIAYVDTPGPRRTIEEGRDVLPLPRRSTAPPLVAVDGPGALMACPDDPAADRRDRPVGADGVVVDESLWRDDDAD